MEKKNKTRLARAAMTLLFALLTTIGAWAQITVTIGNGTSTQNFPLPGFWGFQYDVYLYTPSAAAALDADCDISSIAFNVNSDSETTGAQMSIWVKDVDADYTLAAATTFSDYIDGATQVYTNDDFSSTIGWNTFNFSSTFSHEGGKALLVAVRGVGCTTGGGCSRSCYYTSASNTYWYKRADTSDPGTEVSGTVGSNRANIQLNITYTGAVCLAPSGLTASNVTHNSATLTWNENGTATDWVIEYGTESDFTDATSVDVSGTPSYDLTVLTALTTYYARVKPDCDTEGAHWSNVVTFTTTAVAEAVGNSWSDDFEGASCGWELINGELTNAWAWGTAVNNGGTHALYISNDGGTTNAYTNNMAAMVYATKLLSFAEGKYEFSYDWKANGEDTYDFLRVALVPASVTLTAGTNPPSVTSGSFYYNLPTGWIALDGGSKLNQVTAWQNKTVAVNVPAGNYYLVVAWRNDTSSGTNPPAAIDNVSINKVTCSYEVADLAVSNITTTGATLAWTAGGATQWQVAYSTNSNFEGATESIVSEATCNLTGLLPNSHYYAKVRAYCGGEDFGTWSAVIEFNTDCIAIDLSTADYSENFDGTTVASAYSPSTRTLPICWSFINTSTYATYAVYPSIYYYSYTDYSHSSPNSLRFYSYYSSNGNYDPQDQYAILPPMENLAGKQITLYARGYNSSSTFKIGTMSDPTDVNTFTEIATQDGLSTSYPTDAFEYLIPSTCTDSYVAIMIEAATSSRNINCVYIDDITIREAPTCLKPTNVELTVSGRNATVTWETDASWAEMVLSTNPEVNKEDIQNQTSLNHSAGDPYTLEYSDLAIGDYYFWIRSACEGGGYSDWVGPITFHVGYCTPNPTSHDDKGITGVSFGTGDYVVTNGDGSASLPDSAPYYGDYSNMVGAVQAGVESTIAITTGTNSYPYTFVIWVDIDNSLSFEDNEILYIGKASTGNGTYNATITIPATQATGDYRMRIYGADSYFSNFYNNGNTNWEADHDPCSSGSYRHAHDYTLRVLEAPSCLPAGNVTVAPESITSTSAVISWTNYNGDEATYTVMQGETVLTTTAVDSYTLSGLTAATNYPAGTFTIVYNCDDTMIANVPAFTTPCDVITVAQGSAYTYDFEDETPLSCWTNVAGTNNRSFGSNHTDGGNYKLQFQGTTTGNIVAMPAFTPDINGLVLTFWTRPEGYSYSSCGTFSVGYMTDLDDASTFVAVDTYSYDDWTENEYVKKTAIFTNAPAGAYITFRHNAGSQYYYWFVDDVEVSLVSLLPAFDLSDSENNNQTISDNVDVLANVTLANRTLFKDGTWNTFCVPFDVALANSPLAGAKVMELDVVGTYNGHQTGRDGETDNYYLFFKDASSIKAGKPYFVKWTTTGDDIVGPEFKGVTISTTEPTDIVATGITMKGNFSPVQVTANDMTTYFLMGDNKLYYTTVDRMLYNFRAYFKLDDASSAPNFTLGFDEGGTTRIFSIGKPQIEEGAWYDLNGRKYTEMPTAKGLYIHNGVKVIVK